MVTGEIVSLLLGSSVLGAAVGAYLQSGRQREERFRERMIEAALELLREAAAVEKLLLDVQNARARGEDADANADSILDALDSAWSSIPLLHIVFPNRRVADAAGKLIKMLDVWRAKMSEIDDELPREALDELHGEVAKARDAYAALTRRSIRRRAFRPLALGSSD